MNVLGVTPNLARALATGPFLDGADLKSINRLLVGGGPVGNELQAKIHDVFGGLRLYQGKFHNNQGTLSMLKNVATNPDNVIFVEHGMMLLYHIEFYMI